MRRSPKRRRRAAITCSTTRASESQPRRSKSSSSSGITAGSSAIALSFASSSRREYSRRASAASARARRLRPESLFRGDCFFELGSATHADRGANFRLDLLRHFGMLFQVFARVVFALPDAVFTVGVPRARFVHDVVLHTEFDDFAFARNALA